MLKKNQQTYSKASEYFQTEITDANHLPQVVKCHQSATNFQKWPCLCLTQMAFILNCWTKEGSKTALFYNYFSSHLSFLSVTVATINTVHHW